MKAQVAFGQVLRMARQRKGISQEDFGDVSGRTYISALERGLKNPTLGKIEELSEHLGVHPLTLLVETFAKRDKVKSKELMARIRAELGGK